MHIFKSQAQMMGVMSSHGWPTCAKCKKPVEAMSTKQNFVNRTLSVTAACHEDTETIEIAEELLGSIDGGFSFAGEAFTDKKELSTGAPEDNAHKR